MMQSVVPKRLEGVPPTLGTQQSEKGEGKDVVGACLLWFVYAGLRACMCTCAPACKQEVVCTGWL